MNKFAECETYCGSAIKLDENQFATNFLLRKRQKIILVFSKKIILFQFSSMLH